MDNAQEKTRDLAYALWLEDGAPAGKSDHYWYRAERELADSGELDRSEQDAEVERPPLLAGLPPLM